MAIPRLVHDKKRGIIVTVTGAYFATLDADDAKRVVALWNLYTHFGIEEIERMPEKKRRK